MAVNSQPSRPGRAKLSRPALGAVISAAVAVLLAALLHANSLAIGGFIDDSSELAQAEAALVSTQLSLRTLSQAVVLAEDVELGVAGVATADEARTEAERVVRDLADRLALLKTELPGDTALEAAQLTITLLEDGDVMGAGDQLAGPTLDTYQTLHDALETSRDDSLATLNQAQSWTQRIATIAGFVVVLLAPALAIYAYWRIARRQLATARSEMDTKLTAERRVIQAKDEFISNISHELRTPLTSIYGFSEVLIDQGLIDPDEAHTLISVINEESAELNRMVEDLLTIARDDAGDIGYHLSDFEICDEVHSAVKPLQRSGATIEIACPKMSVFADQLRTRQILRNLLSNVHKWGGSDVYITCHQSGGRAVITVADNGVGIPAEVQQRLFKRYMHEGDAALTTGTVGLGLAVVKILATDMGGDIRYERDAGWTRFVLTLPATAPADEARETEEPAVGAV